MEKWDLAVVGGGVIGCATIRRCLERFKGISAVLIEKESQLAMHQSGRNSGVVHAGYNQKPGSKKAKYVVEGNRRLREYLKQKQIGLVEDGILIVARNDEELATVNELLRRGQQNGAQVELIDKKRLNEIEPNAAGIAALLASDGSSFDSRGYVLSLAADAKELGAALCLDEDVEDLKETADYVTISTNKRTFNARVVVCAGGLYSDRLAHKLGIGLNYHMVPFRGEYHELIPERRDLVRSHIYPAPNLAFPFLGVHLSRTFDGRVLVGPGAVLALGRESYEKLQVNPQDLTEMLLTKGFWKLWVSKEFRSVARHEWKKSLFSREVTREAQQLVPILTEGDLMQSRSGIRAQLVSDKGELVEDLVVEETARTIHVLNAVSPALTCSLPFSDEICQMVGTKIGA